MAEELRVLVVDDDPPWLEELVTLINGAGYRAETATSFDSAREMLLHAPYAVIILDLDLDAEALGEPQAFEGLGLLSGLKFLEELPRRQGRTIIVSGYGEIAQIRQVFKRGAYDFIKKQSFDQDEFLTALGEAASLWDSHAAAETERELSPTERLEYERVSLEFLKVIPWECELAIAVKPEERIHVRVHGKLNVSDRSLDLLHLNAMKFKHWSRQLLVQAPGSSRDYKDMGIELHRLLFEDHPVVTGCYRETIGLLTSKRQLRIVFESSRDLLGVPIELLFSHQVSDYLALLHPIVRRVQGATTKRTPICEHLVHTLRARGEKLAFLLMVSNTEPHLDFIDDLGQELATLLQLEDWIDLTYIRTEEADYHNVCELLFESGYHIIHYIGHGAFRDDSPELSSLFFWDQDVGAKRVRPMTAYELRRLLEDSNARLLHLTCCESTHTGDLADLLEDDFLGIADALVFSGVPSVLGYTWPLSTFNATQMTLTFYKSLIRCFSPELALLEARLESARNNKNEFAWASPILIVQA